MDKMNQLKLLNFSLSVDNTGIIVLALVDPIWSSVTASKRRRTSVININGSIFSKAPDKPDSVKSANRSVHGSLCTVRKQSCADLIYASHETMRVAF